MALRSLDLMIGDWVFIKDYPIKALPKKVKPEHFVRSLVEFEPIPLTPDILEKNGFEDIGDDTYQLEEKPYWFWVDFYKHQYGCEFDTSTYEYEDSESRMKLYGIPYVHELQHAMRLCGIEKEIEL